MDRVGLYGGEEFLAFLPQTPPHLAKEAGERVRQAVEAMGITFNGEKIPLTISVGVAGEAEPKELSGLLKSADAALYQAKHAGRNRVVVSA